jgi:ubiquinone/menaquinone biosynthesis C-methylase UbiE
MTDILKDQVAYYKARAEEYDDWYFRRGRYDWGIEQKLQWANELDHIRRFLHEYRGFKRALELASGTGLWTNELLRICKHITCLDAAPEMHEINRQRQNPKQVKFGVADLFDWEPDEEFDLVSATFWLSHVPDEKLDAFLTKVRRSLSPEGMFFFIDSQHAPTSRAKDHEIPEVRSGISQRKLDDGREFQIVKIFHSPADLTQKLAQAGLQAKVSLTENYFLYGTANRC